MGESGHFIGLYSNHKVSSDGKHTLEMPDVKYAIRRDHTSIKQYMAYQNMDY